MIRRWEEAQTAAWLTTRLAPREATAEYGRQVIEAMIDRVGELADQAGVGPPDLPFLSFDDVEPTWASVQDRRPS